MHSLLVVVLLSLYAVTSAVQSRDKPPPSYDHEVDLPTDRPLVIAHRGCCGVLPEHTLAGYSRSVDEGADAIECDVTVTQDLQLVCMHENWMSETTNVEDVYPPDRQNTYFVPDQLRNVTDYFAIDFTMDELKLIGRRQRYSIRDPNYDDIFEIPTVDELIDTVLNAGRPVGLYLETKDPLFMNSHPVLTDADTTLEDLVLDLLVSYNYTDSRDPCFLQSFSETSIRYLSNHTQLPTVQLMHIGNDVSDERLQELATYVYGIGPDKSMIVTTNYNDQIIGRTDLVERAHSAGLRVHPYTFRNEHEYLAWDYGQDPLLEYEEFFDIGVDGLHTDFPATYWAFLDVKYATCSSP